MSSQTLLFTYCLLRNPVFWFNHFAIQSVRQPFVTYPSFSSTCMTYKTQCHFTGYQELSTKPFPKEAKDFKMSNKYFKHVPLLTCLIYFSSKGLYMVAYIYVLEPPHRALISLSLFLNQYFKSPMCWKSLVLANML